jgi:hypothetical protein
MMAHMRVTFLVVALILIAASVLAFVWVGPTTSPGVLSHRVLVSGRVTGDFADHPWAGTVIRLGSEESILTEDGRFRFAVLPGTHILTVCCSARFQGIHEEITVADRDLDVPLLARPLKEIPGRLVIRGGEQLAFGFIVTAKLADSNVVERAVTALDGTFTLHVMEGDWQLAVENIPDGYTLKSMMVGDQKLREQTLTVASVTQSSLPLQITLQ